MRTRRSEGDERETLAASATGAAPSLFVKELKLTDFRNYASAKLSLEAAPVVLVGDNGSGKTNLLEAVSLLAAGHGLRGRPYAELCRKEGAGSFAVAARLMSRHGEVDVGTGFALDPRSEATGRTVRIAGKEQSSRALTEYVNLVFLIPAMDGLFTGPASDRRKFLDRLVLAVDPKMRSPLARYDRAMRQRNRLFQMREYARALFEGLEAQMAEAGVAIAASRLDAVERLAALIERTRQARGDGPFPQATLALEGTIEAELANRPATEVEDVFRLILAEGRERDRAASRALEGPHLSDLIVTHGPKNAPAPHCSSGEQKALLIGLILAKAELIKELDGACPLVLLDEVAAHLDAARREALFGEILRLGTQAWMTGTDRELFSPIMQEAQILTVNQGKIRT
ncbi:MAG: DNA replication/repair protein RecF [Methyloceanibacter sp.]